MVREARPDLLLHQPNLSGVNLGRCLSSGSVNTRVGMADDNCSADESMVDVPASIYGPDVRALTAPNHLG